MTLFIACLLIYNFHMETWWYAVAGGIWVVMRDRKSTRLNSSHVEISYAVFCLKKKTINTLQYGHARRICNDTRNLRRHPPRPHARTAFCRRLGTRRPRNDCGRSRGRAGGGSAGPTAWRHQGQLLLALQEPRSAVFFF